MDEFLLISKYDAYIELDPAITGVFFFFVVFLINNFTSSRCLTQKKNEDYANEAKKTKGNEDIYVVQ